MIPLWPKGLRVSCAPRGCGVRRWTRRCSGSLRVCCSVRTRKRNERVGATWLSVSWQAWSCAGLVGSASIDRSGHLGPTHSDGGGEAKPQDGRGRAALSLRRPSQLGSGLSVIVADHARWSLAGGVGNRRVEPTSPTPRRPALAAARSQRCVGEQASSTTTDPTRTATWPYGSTTPTPTCFMGRPRAGSPPAARAGPPPRRGAQPACAAVRARRRARR
jgi:hypothetical protein